MATLDLKKTLKHLYKPSAQEISEVSVPPMNYLMIDGTGNPNTSPRYQDAVQALYTMAYTVRGISKAASKVFTVMPLEGLWTFDGDNPEDFTLTDELMDTFEWTMMIVQPEHVTAEMVSQARDIAAQKKQASVLLEDVRFEIYDEGDAVQVLHIGSYDTEGATVRRLHEYIAEQGWQIGKAHHEIYLNDPRKVAPEKLKTIIRQPYESVSSIK